MERPFTGIKSLETPSTYAALTYDPLDISAAINRVRSPKAGAIVTFIGTTRDNFQGKQITTLEYTSYPPLSLQTLSKILTSLSTPSLHSISVIHRLGIVPIGEDSIVISLSTPHRAEAWQIAQECLELVKEKVEIWKREWFADGGIWRANRDGAEGVQETEDVPVEFLEQEDR
ncbi:Molybdopterin synthase catalytic subunit [Arthrobotrys musiformis]|uniref:Molybdopterin synthase catalytic subunit n=1 Tax=Arthrobotrys musiformis TaxID=47236 RepID=A0AAV9WKF9_9PEZI